MLEPERRQQLGMRVQDIKVTMMKTFVKFALSMFVTRWQHLPLKLAGYYFWIWMVSSWSMIVRVMHVEIYCYKRFPRALSNV